MTKKIRSKITFIVPGRGTKPVGGFRMIYEYANKLTMLDFDVCIVHVACLLKSHFFVAGLGRFIYRLLFYRFYKPWFNLDKKIRIKWVFIPGSYYIPDADFIVASSWETAEYVAIYPQSKGKKFYLIQGNESEFPRVVKNGWQERVKNTWNYPMQKVTVSSWLSEKLTERGVISQKIFNGIDQENFFVSNAPENRIATTVIMLYHDSIAKGSYDGITALRSVKINFPALKVILFGVPARPEGLEDWFSYYRLPDRDQLRNLYNQSAIFISPSHTEGWGLPVIESMLCGCSVLTSDIGGFKDFVINEVTGLTFEVKNINDISEKIAYLIKNDQIRFNFAHAGETFVKRFSWDNAIKQFVDLTKSVPE